MTRPAISLWVAAAAGLALVVGFAIFRPAGPPRRAAQPGDRPRIVSLAPSATEILFKLGAGDTLIGVSDCCDFPPEAKRIECVGGFGAPNIERLLAMMPDCVIAMGLEQGNVVGILQGAGIKVLDVPTRNFEELFAAARRIGAVANRSPQAEKLVAEMQAELTAIADNSSSARRPRVFVEVSENPLTTVGGTSFLDDVVARAGGVNVAHEVAEAYFYVSSEKVIEWNPDFILAARMRPTDDVTARFAGRIGWANITAVRQGRIINDIDADLLFRPSPRLIDGLKALSARLHATARGPQSAGGPLK